ncbi:MAG: DegT/DnrJ/EryC1/StrS family aminotransferase [Oscillospiraceae bacterium]|nr:DegT/DnrJ/EryC1/StrS family aminotransferase [Oscillospiraceae bacterium]
MYRMGKEEAAAAARVIESKELFRVNDGAKETTHFEQELAEKVGVSHALCVSGGTTALMSSLAGLGVRPGDEVIVPAYTYIATASAVLAVGAIPVLADVDQTLTLSPEAAERAITPRTRAILPVHMSGLPCNMDGIMEVAKRHNLFVVEDACQAVGGSFRGRRLGTIGDAGAMSFNYFKIISAGEGGALLTNNDEVFKRASIYHDSGAAFWPYTEDKDVPFFVGTAARVSEITGAILRVQLTRLDGILADLRRIRKQLHDSCPAYTPLPSNDYEGDCGVVAGFIFETEKEARAFAKKAGGWLPIDSERHIFCNWEPVVNRRGAFCDEMNPYLMARNAQSNPDYRSETYAKSLDLLSRVVYISINPDWTEEEVAERIARING